MIPAWIIEELKKAEEEEKKQQEEERPRLYQEEYIEEPINEKQENPNGYGLYPHRL